MTHCADTSAGTAFRGENISKIVATTAAAAPAVGQPLKDGCGNARGAFEAGHGIRQKASSAQRSTKKSSTRLSTKRLSKTFDNEMVGLLCSKITAAFADVLSFSLVWGVVQ